MKLLRVAIPWLASALYAQHATLHWSARNVLPEIIDGNTAAVWQGDALTIFHSDGKPTLSVGPNQFELSPAIPIQFNSEEPKSIWFEAVWKDADGTLLLWYHTEPRVCEDGKKARPQIGAAISRDGGYTVDDLGIILDAADEANCSAGNEFFAAGHGDMSAVYDPQTEHFYFFFTNYGGALASQGIVLARMAFADRYEPVGKVHKYYNGAWEEPGLRGLTTPLFPARRSWAETNMLSHWGPAVHWNQYLNQWVMLLNEACCEENWPQTGIWISYGTDLSNLESWTRPVQLLGRGQLPKQPGFYPQILGLEPGVGTDTLGGKISRLYVHGISDWEIEFDFAKPEVSDPPPPPIE